MTDQRETRVQAFDDDTIGIGVTIHEGTIFLKQGDDTVCFDPKFRQRMIDAIQQAASRTG